MRGGTHMLAGAVAGVSMLGSPSGIFVSVIGSLFPDIDTPTSAVGRKIPLFSLIAGGHRGWTHSLMGLILFSAPLLSVFNTEIALAFAAGYISHLLLDMLNPAGVRIFWPIPLTLRFCSIPSKSAIWNSVLSIIFGIVLLVRWVVL